MDRKGRNMPHPREYSILCRLREVLDKKWKNQNTIDRYVVDNPRDGTLVVMSLYNIVLPFTTFENLPVVFKKVEVRK